MGGYDHRPLAGIGGWLTFFLVSIGIFTPLAVIVSLASLYTDPQMAIAYGDAWPAIQLVEWLVTALSLGLAGFLVWRLIRVQVWETVRIVIAGTWTLALGMPLLELLGVAWVADLSVGEMLAGGAAAQFVRGPIYSGLWTAYFLRSERVANTYPKDVEAEVAEVFS